MVVMVIILMMVRMRRSDEVPCLEQEMMMVVMMVRMRRSDEVPCLEQETMRLGWL